MKYNSLKKIFVLSAAIVSAMTLNACGNASLTTLEYNRKSSAGSYDHSHDAAAGYNNTTEYNQTTVNNDTSEDNQTTVYNDITEYNETTMNNDTTEYDEATVNNDTTEYDEATVNNDTTEYDEAIGYDGAMEYDDSPVYSDSEGYNRSSEYEDFDGNEDTDGPVDPAEYKDMAGYDAYEDSAEYNPNQDLLFNIRDISSRSDPEHPQQVIQFDVTNNGSNVLSFRPTVTGYKQYRDDYGDVYTEPESDCIEYRQTYEDMMAGCAFANKFTNDERVAFLQPGETRTYQIRFGLKEAGLPYTGILISASDPGWKTTAEEAETSGDMYVAYGSNCSSVLLDDHTIAFTNNTGRYLETARIFYSYPDGPDETDFHFIEIHNIAPGETITATSEGDYEFYGYNRSLMNIEAYAVDTEKESMVTG